MTLEIGSGLSMNKDKRSGVLTVNPKLLERMQNDPEAENEFTQRMKDIERAERTVTAYYNALGGCVERTSHRRQPVQIGGIFSRLLEPHIVK